MSEMTDDLDWFDREEDRDFPCRTCGAHVVWFKGSLWDSESYSKHVCGQHLHRIKEKAARQMEKRFA